eukprot:TRINITY_DN23144_c0_g1_i2.p1 TRINITY_DN23144_c0_g1~~TRINITY_DN23144_c0_g1_i2.p1  ORF type:complete len:201 (-),score=41.92 TRINITY_DN23144_c0_g1_i2:552-1154(-)
MHRSAASLSPTAVAGKRMLLTSSNSHPTLRFDAYMKATDPALQHAEAPKAGDRFVRKMATYGNVRPSPCFSNESRAARHEDANLTLEASSIPALWHDPIGDPRVGCLEYDKPPEKADLGFVKLYENHALMLPSERRKEAQRIVESEKKWRKDRELIFDYKKRTRILENHYPNGVIGIDGPLFPDTTITSGIQSRLMRQEA